MPKTNLPRRALLVGAAGAVVASRARPAAARDSSDNFVYEINRSEAEWRDLLSDFEFDLQRRDDRGRPPEPSRSPGPTSHDHGDRGRCPGHGHHR